MARMRLALPATAAALLVAAPAHAAYAPRLAVALDPATPGAAAAITSTITQAVGETASKRIVVSFPVGFSANIDAKPSICSAEAEAARACPPDTQIGTAAATASLLVLPINLAGTVHYGGAGPNGIKLIVFLRSQLAGDQTIEGFVSFRPDGGFDTKFDNLPNVLTTSFTLKLDGGDKALSKTPGNCGDYAFKAAFTSQNGEQAAAEAPVTVSGCKPVALELLNVAATKTGTATFNLTAPANGTVTIKRGKTIVAKRPFTGHVGVNRVRTRKLKPGRYRVSVVAASLDGQTVAGARTVTIR